MPRDVATRWNSTFDMLTFALQYRIAIDEIAGNKVANLRQYELNDEEWRIAEQLHDTLKVRTGFGWSRTFDFSLFRFPNLNTASLFDNADLQGCYALFFPLNAQPHDSNPGYGPY